ncbi:MAG: ABC transporter permease [Chroococcidiopsidaceae cyanobacterium CP_BM_ER_R8_30]|nr:ABC transporter permease [Chroococcidiopsidaceae cyanobacterium CP_BM_ER_R8_30]
MSYIIGHPEIVWDLLLEHLQMTIWALLIAVLVALPLALLITHYRWLNVPVMGILGIVYTIPSLALIILLVPLFGLDLSSVVVAMAIYNQIILVRHITLGLQSIRPEILEAARGMGMNSWQRWWRVQVPLMLPIFLAGLRLATIISIAIATIGAKFGAGGLGTLLFDGISQGGRYDKIWAGAIAVAALALVMNGALLALEWASNPSKRIQLRVRRTASNS